ncbi:GntR family transcriptional regulator [Microbacterium halophytorum]|uniref:GntR family transcriptional regulator n=1 Tax=Microbacterium halophytorum TaxID=2067568 RepID=UPI001319BDEF|nr:GntR family transcriptional regulator [Microbacterium halophytorum]
MNDIRGRTTARLAGAGDELKARGPLQVSAQRLSDGVYRQLIDDIRTGELGPGDAVRDRDIAERLGVSRTPVREAILHLERSGLLDVWPGRQTRVRRLGDDESERLRQYFGEVCALHIRFGLEYAQAEQADFSAVDEAAVELAHALKAEWRQRFVALMDAVAAGEDVARGRLLADQLPLMSIVLRSLPEPVGGWTDLSERLSISVQQRRGAEAAALVRALFGLE